ncbi:hypothetical protein LXL04_019458 [Taraxacum kok-saghyz]
MGNQRVAFMTSKSPFNVPFNVKSPFNVPVVNPRFTQGCRNSQLATEVKSQSPFPMKSQSQVAVPFLTSRRSHEIAVAVPMKSESRFPFNLVHHRLVLRNASFVQQFAIPSVPGTQSYRDLVRMNQIAIRGSPSESCNLGSCSQLIEKAKDLNYPTFVVRTR